MKQNVDSVCFVGKVEKILPIAGADRLEQAIISGWECVVQKGQFGVGARVVLATVDAVIPFDLAEELGITSYLKKRKKTNELTVKAVKLRGVYSMATILADANNESDCYDEGEDCMMQFNIKKYEEPPVDVVIRNPDGSTRKWHYKKNPNFLVYQKFPNAKNVPNMFVPTDTMVITDKVHGCNSRYGIVRKTKKSLLDPIKKLWYKITWQSNKIKYLDFEFVYGSHQVEKGSDSQGYYSTDVWADIRDRYWLKDKLWQFFKYFGNNQDVILYGEIYGPGIQKYYEYGEKETKFKLFDIQIEGEYLDREQFETSAAILDLPTCEKLYVGFYDEEVIKAFQFGRETPDGSPAEGVVVATPDRKKIAKFINPAYLEFQSKKEDSTDFH